MSDPKRGAVIGRGARSTVFEWDDGSVIKVPFGDTPDVWTDFEYRYTRAVAALGVRVPEHRAVVDFEGRRCTVSRRVMAPSMLDLLREAPDRAMEFGRGLAELQRSLFEITPSLELPRQVDRLSAKIRRAAVLLGADQGPVLDFLASVDPSAMVLCHGDLHPRNVLMAGDGPVLIDWFDACRGLPVAEVARSLVLFEQFGEIEQPITGELAEAVGTVGQAYRAAAVHTLALDLEELHRWQTVQRIARVAEGFQLAHGSDAHDLGVFD